MYVVVERLIILGRPLQFIIKIQVIDPCFMTNKSFRKEAPETLFTQAFGGNGQIVIGIQVNKQNVHTPSTQGSVVTDATKASEKCSIAIQYLEYYRQ